MPKFRKRPVVIDAIQYLGNNKFASSEPWLVEAVNAGIVRQGEGVVHVKTLEGVIQLSPGSYILCGVAGEVYPCREDIFKATYEPV